MGSTLHRLVIVIVRSLFCESKQIMVAIFVMIVHNKVRSDVDEAICDGKLGV